MVGYKIKLSRLKLTLLTILLLAIHSITGCKEDEQPPEVNVQGGEILIANEGNFGWGEGTLSLYNPDSKAVQNDVYSTKNNEPMGNVLHSIASFNSLYFFVVNNSGKVVVTDTNFVKQKEITGLTSPRNIYKVSNTKAYITDLYADAITIFDLNTLEAIGSISCNGHSEEGVIKDGVFWFTAPETDRLYGIDITTDKITDSVVHIGWKPESIVLDNNESMWILTRGDASQNRSANLSVVSLNGYTVNPIEGVPTSLAYDSNSNFLYYVNNGVWKLDLNDPRDKGSLWLDAGTRIFYSLKVDPENGDVYVSDVKDFVSKSTIYRYSSDGALLDEFSAGIIAGDFFFP